MNIKCILCNNLARHFYGTLAFRLCDDHARLQTHEMERIPFVSDLGLLHCLRCDFRWTPQTFFLEPRDKRYMQIQVNCPLCRSAYWKLPRWRGNVKTPSKRRYVKA